jgi:3-oxoadipate enol-lactonase
MPIVVTDDAVRLTYRTHGPASAPALVFVHSLGTDLHMWEPQVPALASAFRLVRYDARGHGASDVPAGPYSLDRLGCDLLAVLDGLAIERAHVCGLSLGGLTAQWLAVHHPDRLERVVLASTAARIGTRESWTTRIRAVEEGGMQAVAELAMSRFFSAPFRARRPDVVKAFRLTLTSMRPGGYVAACAAVRDADLTEVVSGIRTPALMIAGALDESTPPSDAEALHAAIAGSSLTVLPDAAHLANVEQPDAFNAALLRLLTGGVFIRRRP